MINQLLGLSLGAITGVIGKFVGNLSGEHQLYSDYQRRILDEMEDYEHSSSMSWFSSSASSTTDDMESEALGTPYFASIKKRLGEEEEFFKKEEFYVE